MKPIVTNTQPSAGQLLTSYAYDNYSSQFNKREMSTLDQARFKSDPYSLNNGNMANSDIKIQEAQSVLSNNKRKQVLQTTLSGESSPAVSKRMRAIELTQTGHTPSRLGDSRLGESLPTLENQTTIGLKAISVMTEHKSAARIQHSMPKMIPKQVVQSYQFAFDQLKSGKNSSLDRKLDYQSTGMTYLANQSASTSANQKAAARKGQKYFEHYQSSEITSAVHRTPLKNIRTKTPLLNGNTVSSQSWTKNQNFNSEIKAKYEYSQNQPTETQKKVAAQYRSQDRGLPQVKEQLNLTNLSFPNRQKKQMVNNFSLQQSKMQNKSYERVLARNNYKVGTNNQTPFSQSTDGSIDNNIRASKQSEQQSEHGRSNTSQTQYSYFQQPSSQKKQKSRLLRDVLKQGVAEFRGKARLDKSAYQVNKLGLIEVAEPQKRQIKGQARIIAQRRSKEALVDTLNQESLMNQENDNLTNDQRRQIQSIMDRRVISDLGNYRKTPVVAANRAVESSLEFQTLPPRTAVNDNFDTEQKILIQTHLLPETESDEKSVTPERANHKKKEDQWGSPEVFPGAFSLSKHEHRLQNKLQSALKMQSKPIIKKPKFGVHDESSMSSHKPSLSDIANVQNHLPSDQSVSNKNHSEMKKDKNKLQQELKRLQRSTINVQIGKKKFTPGSEIVSQQQNNNGQPKKPKDLFYNPKFFDPRFDKMGNFLPPKDYSPKSPDLLPRQSSSKTLNDDQLDIRRRSRSTLQAQAKSRLLQYQNRDKNQPHLSMSVAGVIIEHSQSSMSQLQESLEGSNEGSQERIKNEALRAEQKEIWEVKAKRRQARMLEKQRQDRERLYKWVPGAQKKPTSKRFRGIIERYTDDEKRKIERLNQKKIEENSMFAGVLDVKHDQNILSMAQRERRIKKAEDMDMKRKMDEQKGLRRVKDINDEDYTSSEYHSDNSQVNSDTDKSEKQEQKLEEIFNMNEVQIHHMLAQAVANEGEIDDINQQLEANKPAEMTEKQRIRCLLLVQLFFAGLGDSSQISLREQGIVCKRVRQDYTDKKKEEQKAIKEQRKKERADRKAARKAAKGIESATEEEKSSKGSNDESNGESSDESSNSDQSDNDSQLSGSKKKKSKKMKAGNEKINIDTNTIVQTESKLKRQKLDDAVRKILLFKDMKQTDTKGDADPAVKLNQTFIRDTISQYSGSITAPTNIIKKALKLNGYFLNEGVCKSLGSYFNQLTFNQLQEIDLVGNGLKDSSMATLLNGLSDQRALRYLTYGDNELGPQTADEISKILFWPNPTNLEKLILKNLKISSYATAMILSALGKNRKLIHFEIDKIPLNNGKNFDYLCQFLKSNKALKNLRLSWNSFMPQQIVQVLSEIKRRKTIQYLNLSNNNLMPNAKSAHLLKQFINSMRRFILRTQIFHLDLSSMSLGKTVAKLVQSIKASSTLNCVHLGMNNIPLEIIYYMDKEFGTPETRGNKLNYFRPRELDKKSVENTKRSSRIGTEIKIQEDQDSNLNNNGNLETSPEKLNSEREVQHTLKEDLMAELERIRAEKQLKNGEKGNEPKMKAVKQLVEPLMQEPLVYQRILNHPEFVFPLYFMVKPGQRNEASRFMQMFIQKKLMGIQGLQMDQVKKSTNETLDERQDTVYYSQEFTNRWSKIEPLTNKQIKKGKKGNQPDFSDNMGREGIVNTHHDTCWVCEKRKYVLLSLNMDPTSSKKTWGIPIKSVKEKQKLRKKYLPNDGQMPGNLNDQPILVSSMNDWFPIHMMPVITFAMMYDYSLMQDMSRNTAQHKNTQDSVEKFKEGYQQVLDHASNVKKLDSVSLRLYKEMWRSYILKNLIYPHDTLFIDFPAPEEEIDPDFMFMFAGFVKPGKHRSFLYDPEEDLWYKRDFFVDERDTELPQFANYENLVADKADIMNSILKDWKVDNAATYRKCVEHDQTFWKIGNSQFIKDPIEYQTLKGQIVKHFHILKDIFIHICAKDDFPCLSQFGTEEFSNAVGLIDQKQVKKDTVNRMFIAANVSDRDDQEAQNPTNAMIRYEFIEFLVRMARYKYKDAATNPVHDTVQAFDKLMVDLLIPYHTNYCQDWQPFRDNYLTETVIDHLMHANKKGLEVIFVKFASLDKNKAFTENYAFHFEKLLKLNLNDQSVKYAYGMCQQTVEAETKKIGQYNRINFLEFVEFVCRILYIKFKIDLESNQLDKSILASGDAHHRSDGMSHPSSQLISQNTSIQNTKRALEPKDEEQRQDAHKKHLYAFKEFCCAILDPFFTSQGQEFLDPDEDQIQEDSEESNFEYDLPSGYNSQDGENPDMIPMMSSGNQNSDDDDFNPAILDEQPHILLDISALTMAASKGQNSSSSKDVTKGTKGGLNVKQSEEHKKIRALSAKKRQKQLLKGESTE